MKRNATRILSLVLAIALIMSMSLTAFAMDGHEVYLSPAAGTSYTTIVGATTSTVSLEVYFSAYDETIANVDERWYNTGFNSPEAAEAVQWSIPAGGNPNGLISTTIGVTSGTVNSLTTSKATVTLNSGVTGVAIVHAKYSDSMTLDLVIARDAAGNQNAVTTHVYVVDVTASTNKRLVDNEEVAVYAPVNNSGSLMAGKAGAFQKQPTAMGTLDALLTDELIDSATLYSDGSYVSEINELEYWSYAVYNTSTGALVDITQNVSASIYALSSGQTVVWKHGAWSFASNLSTEIASW